MRIYRVHPAELDRRPVRNTTRAVTVAEQEQIRGLRRQGWSVTALCIRFDISRRTLYRYLEGDFAEVEVGGFVATFWLRPNRTPEQIEPWMRTNAA